MTTKRSPRYPNCHAIVLDAKDTKSIKTIVHNALYHHLLRTGKVTFGMVTKVLERFDKAFDAYMSRYGDTIDNAVNCAALWVEPE